MPYRDGLKHESINLDPLAALRAPATVLLGVTEAAAAVLRQLGGTTVFDLATLPLFVVAAEILDAASHRGNSAAARLDTVPGGYVADVTAPSPGSLAAAPLMALRAIDTALAAQFRDVLQLETVADLGRWLPYHFARKVLAAATRDSGDQADPAAELVPRMGEYPTERHFYSTMVIDHVEAATTQDLKTAGAIDIAPTVSADFGFSAPAVGARLTFEQSWFAHGVTLGNLLHSVALAPGESTRIAVVDWSRRTRTTGTETITEAEALTAATSHNRAVSEVQEAVATEAQSGFSHTESTATTKQGGLAIGGVVGGVLFGASASAAKTKTTADSFSASFGSRNLAATMSQNVMDATQQAASSVRDRRASLVTEVAEQEHEAVSTRILANYNHMHALTVQYYEVVEVYRVRVDLNQVERCLFVPMKLVEFDEATIRRYQEVLATAALDRRARELLMAEIGTIRLTSVTPPRPWPGVFDVLATAAVMARTEGESAGAEPAPETPPRPPTRRVVTAGQPFQLDAAEVARAERIVSYGIVRPGSADVFLPRDAVLAGLTLRLGETTVPASAVALKLASGQPSLTLADNGISWIPPRPVLLEELSEIFATTTSAAPSGPGQLTLEINYHGALFPVTIPIQVVTNRTATFCRFGDPNVFPELLKHLRANRLHYSQAIWRALDASTLALLLSRYTFEGRPVADQVDPEPLMIAGNYVVLRMPAFTERRDAPPDRQPDTGPLAAARTDWRQWLEGRGLTFGPYATTEQLVPIPTGGVFAEAVLGRSNSAEKLDATRFWNWQDSPIPLAPPEIAAITMQSRAQPSDARPGQLGQPVLNIVNPTALPDPTGLGASLAALQSGGMFRDMSGLAATIGLAQATAAGSVSAAANAGQLAAANMAVAAQHDIERRKIETRASPAATVGTPRTSSESGALLNTAIELDRMRQPTGGGGAGGEPVVGSGGSDTMPGMEGTRALAGNRTFTGAAFQRAAFGPMADLAPAAVPSQIDLGIGPIRMQPEQFLYPQVKRTEDLATFAMEIDALAHDEWRPASPDFRAISIRTNGMKPISAQSEVNSVQDFFEKVALAPTTNFFGYMQHDDPANPSIPFVARVTRHQFFPSEELNVAKIDELKQRIQSSGDPLAALIRMIRNVNAADPRKRLFLYLCSFFSEPSSWPARLLAEGLADLLDMEVFFLGEPIWFRPDLHALPRDQKRGQISLGTSLSVAKTGNIVDNAHDLTPNMLSVP